METRYIDYRFEELEKKINFLFEMFKEDIDEYIQELEENPVKKVKEDGKDKRTKAKPIEE